MVDLIPNGSVTTVTNDNKEEYLNMVANYRLAIKVKDEVEAFLKGVHSIIPQDLLSNFDENELEVKRFVLSLDLISVICVCI